MLLLLFLQQIILAGYKKQTNYGTRYNQHVNLLLRSLLLLGAELHVIMRFSLQVHIYDLLNVFVSHQKLLLLLMCINKN